MGVDVAELLQRHGVQFEEKGSQFLLGHCLFCGKHKHMYVNKTTGAFDCKSCGADGGFYKLQQILGDVATFSEPEQKEAESPLPLDTQQKALGYYDQLMKQKDKMLELSAWWGISLATIKAFKLGICTRNEKLWLSIPTISDGMVFNIKYRTWKGLEKEFSRELGGKSLLYNNDKMKEMRKKYIIICEGEKDCLTLLDKGFKNVIGNSGGANTFLPEWLKQLEDFERIYLAFDNDDAGNKGMRKLLKRLGTDRCYTVSLPEGEDINDFFLKDKKTVDDFKKLLRTAKLFELPGVITLAEGYKELLGRFKEGKDIPTITTPWNKVNRVLNGGFFDGQLITLGGPAKSTKTNVAYLIAEHNAKQGTPVLLYELEMQPADLVKRNVTRTMKVSYRNMDSIDVLLTQMKQKDLPLYIGKASGTITYKNVIETIRAAYKRFGIGFAIIDHGHILVRSSDNLVQELGVMIKEIAYLAKELEIPILLLAQPNKYKDTRVRGTYEKLGWTNAFGTDSDVIIMLHRNRADQIPTEDNNEQEIIQKKLGRELDIHDTAFSPIVHFYVDASRTSSGGYVKLWCDEMFFTMEEVDDSVEETSRVKKQMGDYPEWTLDV